MDKNIDSLKKNKEIDTMLHGWEEIKQMLLEVSPVFTFDDDKKQI